MKFAESQLISMHAMVYAVLTQPYTHAHGVWPSYTMACILMNFLRAHTQRAVALIFMAAVVQGVLLTLPYTYTPTSLATTANIR